MAVNTLQKIIKTFIETDDSSPHKKITLLTTIRRHHVDETNVKALKDNELCELCNSIVKASISNDEKLHLEACRTLDVILPETKNRKFDFFQSILQINRKKRLKALTALSILKDETVATVCNKLSIIKFLEDCLKSIKPDKMEWLLKENADNKELMQTVESKLNNFEEDFEEKVVDKALELLSRVCDVYIMGLNVRQFDSFIMDKVLLLAYMGHRKQRSRALVVFKQAVKNDMGLRIRSLNKPLWDQYRTMLQSTYCKRMTLLVLACDLDWSIQWETSILFIGTDLHKGANLVNTLLKVEEIGFKSVDMNRRQAFVSWKALIDNFALDQRELATSRRIKLLCVPLNAKNSKTEDMMLTKLEVWWHLIYKIYPSLGECTESVLEPFLSTCFGPFSKKPLFIHKSDENVPLGKKFLKTQIFAINAFIQLIVNTENQSKIPNFAPKVDIISPVNNFIFEKMYKVFFNCLAEIIVLLIDIPSDVFNKPTLCKILWENLVKRVEEYEKMKTQMYEQIRIVVEELIKKNYLKHPFIRNFILDGVFNQLDSSTSNMQFNESSLKEILQTILQLDDCFSFSNESCKTIESLLWHLIKPKKADVYNPKTIELLQQVLEGLDQAKTDCTKIAAVSRLWCVLANTAKKYIEDSQNINEGNLAKHNFSTLERIIAFPFTFIQSDHELLESMAKSWKDLYVQFDFQAELIVTVQSNEILYKTANMIISILKKDKNISNFTGICIDGLFAAVNYEKLIKDKDTSPLLILFRDLILTCLQTNSIYTDRVLKALSSLLLGVFGHSAEKTAAYLKIIEPAIKKMLTKNDDSFLEKEIVNTWTTIVSLFKNLQKEFSYDLLLSYRETISLAMLHLNEDIVHSACSIVDLRDGLDDKSKKLIDELVKDLQTAGCQSNFTEAKEINNKIKSKSAVSTKPVGSFLNRKSLGSSNKTPGKENAKVKVVNPEPDSQDFVVINTDLKLDVNRLTEHQKEKLKSRRDYIPGMYNDVSHSGTQDSQEIQRWFDAQTRRTPLPIKVPNSPKVHDDKANPNFKNVGKFSNKDAENISAATIEAKNTTEASNSKRSGSSNDVASKDKNQCQSDGVNGGTSAIPLPKKLDFDSTLEYPANKIMTADSATSGCGVGGGGNAAVTNISAVDVSNNKKHDEDVIDDSQKGKMKRRESMNGTDGQGNLKTATASGSRSRRSMQPTTGNLRRSNSSENLLNKRGRKRRNSDSNSEGTLYIEREKRPRLPNPNDVIAETLEYSQDSLRSATDSEMSQASSLSSSQASSYINSQDSECDGKKFSKRQMTEMSRLKIDMRFEPLPNRRSVVKKETPVTVASDSKKPLNNDGLNVKEQKSKSDVKSGKLESNSQENIIVRRRSSKLLKSNENGEQESKKDGNKNSLDIEVSSSKITSRKSLPNSIVIETKPVAKKPESEETSKVTDIAENTDKIAENIQIGKNNFNSIDDHDIENQDVNSIASQDSDIVQCSQQPTISMKIDKPDCYVKILKDNDIEMAVNSQTNSQDVKEKSGRIIQEMSVALDDTSIIPATIQPEKPVSIRTEQKKIERNEIIGKIPAIMSHITSPKKANQRKSFPVHNRAAHMIGLVSKQLPIKVGSSVNKTENSLNDDVPSLSTVKKDSFREIEPVLSSPSTTGSRQEKMFMNMSNNRKSGDKSLSPSMSMFCNLRNKGERISPKLEQRNQEKDLDISSLTTENGSTIESPSGKSRRELPMLEWTNANPPSFNASPSASILKRMNDTDIDTPNRKKRVSFADPPVSREMGYEILTETSSPPRLEKLPPTRSPISRRENRKFTRTRLSQLTPERMEIEVTVASPKVKLTTVLAEHPLEDSTATQSITPSTVTTLATSPSMQTSTSGNTSISEITSQSATSTAVTSVTEPSNSQDADIFGEHEDCEVKAPLSQDDDQSAENNTSIKLDSINLSSINKSDNASSLEDTVDVENISSSFDNSHNISDKAVGSCSQGSGEPGDTLPVTDSVFSNLPIISQETQNSVAQLSEPENLDSTLPVYPTLTSCTDGIDTLSKDLVDPLFKDNLVEHLAAKAISSVGDMAQLTEREINRLPIRNYPSKIVCVKTALSRHAQRLGKLSDSRPVGVSSSTPLGHRTKSLFEDLIKSNVSAVQESKPMKRASTDNAIQTSPIKKQRNDQEACKDFMDHCDDDFLFEAFIKKFDYERLLKAYKEKMVEKPEKELKKETLNILGLNVTDDSEASFKASTKTVGLHKVLQQLPMIFDSDEEFYDTVLKTYKKNLKPANLLNVMKPTELKEALAEHYSVNELLSIINSKLTKNLSSENGCIKSSNEVESFVDFISPEIRVKTENSAKRQVMFETLVRDIDGCKLSDLFNEAIKCKLQKK
ncbi:telomere-associated protein RIF1 [Trichogramma pretiosum]|uniref:telomere-associated protein RIF1 n=1 Tax=Trichogramma pretiosum TaxID=7493 RepID=UPI0006C960BC|nr:telomere-associated protein RIF1 [Trichogramma pretiosum]